jgi:ammonia channel protein AmtB
LRLVHAWLLMVLGGSAAMAGVWLLSDRNAPPSPPHVDMAGPDFSAVDITRIAIGMIVLGCGFVAVGWWLRPKKSALPGAIIAARSRRTSSSPRAR